MKPNLLGWTSLAGLAALLALAMPAAAEWYEGKPECPPDVACTTSASAEGKPAPGDETGDGPTYADCSGGVCADDGRDKPASSTCMDGAEPREDCPDEVQYLGPPARDDATAQESAQRDVPGLGVPGLALAGLGVGALIAARRKP